MTKREHMCLFAQSRLIRGLDSGRICQLNIISDNYSSSVYSCYILSATYCLFDPCLVLNLKHRPSAVVWKLLVYVIDFFRRICLLQLTNVPTKKQAAATQVHMFEKLKHCFNQYCNSNTAWYNEKRVH